MKKLLALLLTLLLAVSAIGCSAIDKDTAVALAGAVIDAVANNNGININSNTNNGVNNNTNSGLNNNTNNGSSSDLYLAPSSATTAPQEGSNASVSVVYGQSYDTKDEVAAYIHFFGQLPPNYITKSDAKALGWVSTEGNLWQVTDHKSIGGDYFGNYEGLLPKKSGRKYYECDIGYTGGTRNGKRIIYSNDGLIYYTGDHYKTFTLLYGEE